ncbi:MAG: adenylate/guanylate cyclase domain-containing protein [Sneathiella sp.]|uniref:adenylate/guanylate cyclase domain-containing protein n=1 Tax=Sneathiella sp. TaxID=1964365 RepID=UPI0030012355
MTSPSRKLAAILSADVVGYSRLMGQDEVRTLSALRSLRKETFEPVIVAHRGTVVKRMGDGWLVEFASVVDAVRCALNVQKKLADEDVIKLRVGIHIGDIVHEDEDIYGDGVNIASRLQEQAAPGGIAISAFAHDSLDGVVRSGFQSLGASKLKNISQEIEIFGWGETAPAPDPITKPSDRSSVMVLPFSVSGGAVDGELMAEGLTDAVITALSRFSWFLTLPRNTSNRYRNKSVDINEIRRDHHVSYVLESSLRTSGARARISAELLDTRTGKSVWSDRFDGNAEDPFELEDKITRSILSELTSRIIGAETQRVKTGGDGSAWDLMMQGRGLLWRISEDDINAAQSLFHRAIELEPGSGLGQADLAWSYGYQGFCGWGGRFEDVGRKAIIASEKAIAADPTDAYALAAGSGARCFTGDSAYGITLARRAIKYNYNLAAAHTVLALALFQTADYEEALEHVGEAFALSPNDPLKSITLAVRGIIFLMTGQHEEMQDNAQVLIRDFPGMPTGWRHLASSYALLGQSVAALNVVDEKILSLLPGHTASEAGRTVPFGDNKAARDRFVEALVRAGLPT